MTDNKKWCENIAKNLEAYHNGEVYRCPECGEEFSLYEDGNYESADTAADGIEKATCPSCGYVSEDSNDFDQLSLYDYFDDCYDIEYRVGSDKQLRSVCIMVACGGPNIYIDTGSKRVELYWWGDRAYYPIKSDVCDEIDSVFEEIFNC